jgi:hypothetical protein
VHDIGRATCHRSSNSTVRGGGPDRGERQPNIADRPTRLPETRVVKEDLINGDSRLLEELALVFDDSLLSASLAIASMNL